jgi:Flp pilus assembly protein TadG
MRAQALVEFAFVLPIMLLLLLGMIDLGRAFVFGVATQEGSRQAARLAASANYNMQVDDAAVLGRLVAASAPALTGCSATTTSQSCNGGSWTFNVCVSSSGGPCTTVAAARSANTLAGSQVTVTATGSVGLFPGLDTGIFGLKLGQIGVRGQSSMVIL